MDIYIQIQNLIPFLKVLWLIDILVGRNVCWRGGEERKEKGEGKGKGERGRGTFMDSTSYDQLLHRSVPPPRPPPTKQNGEN